MIKKWHFYIALTAIISLLSSQFRLFDLNANLWFINKYSGEKYYNFPSKTKGDYNYNPPFLNHFFIGYKEAIAFKESQGNYKKINSIGYLGKYQFGRTTLQSIGVRDIANFTNNAELQEKAFVALLSKNKWELRFEIEKYKNTVINGVYITESGLLAAAHLGGVSTVKRYLKANGKGVFKDIYGTSIKSYIQRFAHYDTSFIKANNNAKVQNI